MSEENVEVVRRFRERDDRTSLDSLMAILNRGHDDVRAWSPKSADVWLSGELAERESGRSPDRRQSGMSKDVEPRRSPNLCVGRRTGIQIPIRISYRSPTDPELGRSSCFGREAALPMERGRRSRPLTSLALVRSSGQLPRAELGRRNRVLDPNLAQSLRTFIIS